MLFVFSRSLLVIVLLTSSFLFTGCGALSTRTPATVTTQWMDRSVSNTNAPRSITLLLPLRGTLGPVGQAIRQGFLTAAQMNHQPLPQINIIDTTTEASIEAAYHKALSQKTQLIVGPLLRSQVQRIAGLDLKVPVIALNYVDPDVQTAPNLYQFGLSPRDEARQAVHLAWENGYRRALLLAVNTAWGTQLAQAFRTEWTQLGGIIVEQASLSPRPRDLTAPMRHLLQFSMPNQRRTDFDVIFLASDKTIARQVKPLLKFFYAGDVPVYASASVYETNSSRQSNNDLNGLIFCAAPWMLGQRTAYANVYAQLQTTTPPALLNRYRSYYALGVDAFVLTQHLAVLNTTSATPLSGATGQLQLSTQRTVTRQLPCAQFKQGRLVTLSRN
jgi:uncharacterized protein